MVVRDASNLISSGPIQQRAAASLARSAVGEVKPPQTNAWLDRVREMTEVAEVDDFDVVAWFAADDDDNETCRITECWYG